MYTPLSTCNHLTIHCFSADYDECSGSHRCDHRCIPDGKGWFTCDCDPGFVLQANGYACKGLITEPKFFCYVPSCRERSRTSGVNVIVANYLPYK